MFLGFFFFLLYILNKKKQPHSSYLNLQQNLVGILVHANKHSLSFSINLSRYAKDCRFVSRQNVSLIFFQIAQFNRGFLASQAARVIQYHHGTPQLWGSHWAIYCHSCGKTTNRCFVKPSLPTIMSTQTFNHTGIIIRSLSAAVLWLMSWIDLCSINLKNLCQPFHRNRLHCVYQIMQKCWRRRSHKSIQTFSSTMLKRHDIMAHTELQIISWRNAWMLMGNLH